jgi:Protein of unknown function (DUF3421)
MEGSTVAYVGRVKYEGQTIVGKFIREWNSIYIPYYSKEIQIKPEEADIELYSPVSYGKIFFLNF